MDRITPKGSVVSMVYDEENAQLVVTCAGKQVAFDEDDCDKLLRLIEIARDPCEDLAEFFAETDFPVTGYRVAAQFVEHAREIASHVYAA